MDFDWQNQTVRKAVEISIKKGVFSTAMLQTYLGKSHDYVYSLAAWLEEKGVIGPLNGNKPREMLINSMDDFDALFSGSVSKSVDEYDEKNEIEKLSNISKALEEHPTDADFIKRIIIWSIVLVLAVIGVANTSIGFLIIVFLAIGGIVHSVVNKKKVDEYFSSSDFSRIKKEIIKNTEDINNLNQHIKDLKNSHTGENIVERGDSELSSGGYNFKRSGWQNLTNAKNTHYCSLQVVKNSKEQPFKYICKYFDIVPNEENLSIFEEMFNNFSAAEQGQVLLLRERNRIFLKIDKYVPNYVLKYAPNNLVGKLGFKPIDVSNINFPQYVFSYVSAGGNSTAKNIVVMDMHNLENYIQYLNKQIKWKESIAGQRALMTASLREKIKKRDGYTCKKCGSSVKKEPNLLLEIDHIIPLAKGGKSTEKNLQTLCWRCNRSKGARIE